MNKKAKAMILLTIVVICATVGLWFAVNGAKIEYTEVNATILSSKTVKVKSKKGTVREKYEVMATYDGDTYPLENVYNSYSYRPGASVTAYYAKGHLYANTAGVKTSTPLAKVYFVGLFASIALLIGTPGYISYSKR